MKYQEGMPITALVEAGGCMLVGGGGGHALYGYPNELFLLSASLEILDRKVARSLIVSVKVYGRFAVLEYESAFELFEIAEGKICGPRCLPEGSRFPVVKDDAVVYLRKNQLWQICLADFLKGKLAETEYAMDGVQKEDTLLMLLGRSDCLSCLLLRGEDHLLVGPHETEVLAGEIKDSSAGGPLAYLLQVDKELSQVGLGAVKVLEPKCTTICSEASGECYVGTGDGWLIKYRDGAEMWRKQVFKSAPISSVAVVKGRIYCSSITGRIAAVSSKLPLSFVRGGAIGVLAAAVLAGTKYFATDAVRSSLAQVRSACAGVFQPQE